MLDFRTSGAKTLAARGTLSRREGARREEGMDRIGVGVVGAGDVADRHIEGLVRASGVWIAAVAEPNEERRAAFAKRYGVELASGDHRPILDSRSVDVVLILTPHDTHTEITLDALNAGKHVICEKPMAPRLEDCDRMLEAAARCGRSLWVTHTLRSDFFYRIASARLSAGALGRLIGASFRWFTDELGRLEDPAHWKGTRDRSGGGVLIDGGCHVADLANGFFGPARRVHAFGKRLVAKRESVAEDTAAFSIEFESGALASALLGFTAGSSWRRPGGFAAGMDVSSGEPRARSKAVISSATTISAGRASNGEPASPIALTWTTGSRVRATSTSRSSERSVARACRRSPRSMRETPSPSSMPRIARSRAATQRRSTGAGRCSARGWASPRRTQDRTGATVSTSNRGRRQGRRGAAGPA